MANSFFEDIEADVVTALQNGLGPAITALNLNDATEYSIGYNTSLVNVTQDIAGLWENFDTTISVYLSPELGIGGGLRLSPGTAAGSFTAGSRMQLNICLAMLVEEASEEVARRQALRWIAAIIWVVMGRGGHFDACGTRRVMEIGAEMPEDNLTDSDVTARVGVIIETDWSA